MIWLRKLAAIVLFSLGVALAVLPWPPMLAGESTREFVWLDAQAAPFTEASARKRFGAAFAELDYESLEPYPGVLDAFLRLQGESGSACVPPEEWQQVLREHSLAEAEGAAFAFRDDLHQLSEVTQAEGRPVKVVDGESAGTLAEAGSAAFCRAC